MAKHQCYPCLSVFFVCVYSSPLPLFYIRPPLPLLSLSASISHVLLCFFSFTASIHCFRRQIFKEQLHTRVVLVAVEIWTDRDHIPISVKPLELLRDFSKYRQQSIKHHADSVQLLS